MFSILCVVLAILYTLTKYRNTEVTHLTILKIKVGNGMETKVINVLMGPFSF